MAHRQRALVEALSLAEAQRVETASFESPRSRSMRL